MVTYLIKSTACLLIFYGFFHFFLRPYKILIFNRFYLVSSLIISLIIPMIIIPVQYGFPIAESLDKFTISVEDTFQTRPVSDISVQRTEYQNILPVFFIIISSVLLIRYLVNIFRIIRKTFQCKRIENNNTTLILVEEKTLPYSFFRYIFVNKSDFENDRINKELLMHEETHCLQYHSFDIIVLELIHVFFWFNPAIWLFRRSILLNHEYSADNNVIAGNAASEYPQILLNLVIQNNTNTLVSHVKNSLIKNRLIMMKKNESLHNAILRKIAGVSLILLIGTAFTLGQTDKLENYSSNLLPKSTTQQDNISDQWWKPIVSKHGINYESFTIHQQFVIFGNKTINDDIESFTDVVAISNRGDSTYCIYKSKTASYDIKNKVLDINNCTMDIFNWNSKPTEPVKLYADIKYRVDFVTGIYIMGGGHPVQVSNTQSQVDNLKSNSSDLNAKSSIQQNKFPADWWKPIAQKYGIKYNSYTVHNQFVIFGKKTLAGDVESFNDVIAIAHGIIIDGFWMYKSKMATYNTQSNVLTIYDCSMEQFNWNSKTTEPVNSYTHMLYSYNFDRNVSFMGGDRKGSDTIPIWH
jgi:hypothetical protein